MTAIVKNVTEDSWFGLYSAVDYGNGKGPRMYVGKTTYGTITGRNRFSLLLERGTLFDGTGAPDNIPGPATSANITVFRIHLRVKSGGDGIGTAPKFFLEQAVTAAAENNATADMDLSTNGTSGLSKWPTPSTVTTNRGLYAPTSAPAADTWIYIDMLAFGRAWFDGGPYIGDRTLIAIACDGASDDEDTTSRRISFYTAQSTSPPFFEMWWDANQPPYAPTDLSAVPGSDGTSVTVTGRHTDPEQDAATKMEVQWIPDPGT